MSANRDQDWESILRELIAYANALLQDDVSSSEKAEMAKDFAVEAITKYLEEDSKFDVTRNSNLVWYLKYNILRRLVSNYYKSSYKKKQVRLYGKDDEEDILESLYVKEYDLEGKIDAEKVLSQLETKIEHDSELLSIFKGRYYQNLKRSEICLDLNITPNEYNNRMKRLKRLSKPVLDSFITNKGAS